MKSVNELPFYNYSIAFYNYPTTCSSITTSLTHYGSYRTVEPFDPPIVAIGTVHNIKHIIIYIYIQLHTYIRMCK